MQNRIIISLVLACSILTFVLFGERILAATKGIIVEKTIKYNRANSAYFFDIIETKDGGFLAVGLDDLSDDEETLTKSLIVKYNSEGNLEWEHSLSASNIDSYKSVIEVEDGYIVVGYTKFTYEYTKLRKNKDKDDTTNDVIIVHYGTDGEIKNVKSFGGTDEDYISKIVKISDGFILVGDSASDDGDLKNKNNGLQDAIIAKYSFDLEKEWVFNFGGTLRETFTNVAKIDTGYVAVGSTGSKDFDLKHNNGNEDALIVSFDFNGNILWFENIGGSAQDGFMNIVPYEDGVIATGYTLSNNLDFENMNSNGYGTMFAKFTKEGMYENIRIISDNSGSSYFPIIEYEDGYLGSGRVSSDVGNKNLFTKYTINGDKEWESSFIGNDTGGIETMIRTSDDKILAIEYHPNETKFIYIIDKKPEMNNSQVLISIAIVLVIATSVIITLARKRNEIT